MHSTTSATALYDDVPQDSTRTRRGRFRTTHIRNTRNRMAQEQRQMALVVYSNLVWVSWREAEKTRRGGKGGRQNGTLHCLRDVFVIGLRIAVPVSKSFAQRPESLGQCYPDCRASVTIDKSISHVINPGYYVFPDVGYTTALSCPSYVTKLCL